MGNNVPLISLFKDSSKDVNAIKTAIDLGITHIDTAEIYANGEAEN